MVIRDVATGRVRRLLVGHRAPIFDLDYSPSGRWLASASRDQTVRLWDGASGVPLRVLRGHRGTVLAVRFGPAGRWLASGGEDRTVRLWPMGADGQPMVRRVVQAVCAAGLDQVIVVVGAHAAAVEQPLSGLGVDIVVNEAWAGGMSTSLQAGLAALDEGIQATFVVLADQPGLAPDLLRALTARYHDTGAAVVAPFFRGKRGNPVLFDRALFPELMAVEGDRGGRALVTRVRDRMECVEFDDPAVLLDVDTEEDYEQASS